MNFCTSDADAFDPGFWNPLGRLASQYEFTSKLLRFWNTLTLPSGHLSKLTDLILLMCVPNDRCYPEHRRHTKEPNVIEAHLGVLLVQSAQN